MKKVLGLAVVSLAMATPAAMAQDSGSWLIRARALNLQSANKDTTGLSLSVNDKTFPEVDISYFISPSLAVELILTYPQKHDIRSGGTKIGTLKHLPPSLLAQWHFPMAGFRPYVGAGVNLTLFSDVKFDPAVVAALNPRIDKRSTGLAFQVGADLPIGGGWLLNVDVKKVQLETDVFSGNTRAGTFKVDPTLLSLGVGKRF
jgi:outer membrane protein